MGVNTSEVSDKRIVLATLVPALATTLAFLPSFLTLPDEGQASPLWLFLGAAPLAALIVNRLWPAAPTRARAIKTGLPQILLFPLLFFVDIWIDDRRGFDFGREMFFSRGIQIFFGTLVGIILGVFVMLLVALCALFGTWLWRTAAVR